jgi:hypothetical protein
MTADPIKDALRAAALARCQALDGLKCDPDPMPCGVCVAEAAAAVAAFLRASSEDGYEFWGERDTARGFRTLADEVERAAREGGQ